MISQYSPVLEAGDRVLDPRMATSVATPRAVMEDAVASNHRCDEFGNVAVATVGQDARVLLAERLDLRATVVERIVAILLAAG